MYSEWYTRSRCTSSEPKPLLDSAQRATLFTNSVFRAKCRLGLPVLAKLLFDAALRSGISLAAGSPHVDRGSLPLAYAQETHNLLPDRSV